MNNDLTIAIDKYLNGEASESEKSLVDAWYLSFESCPGLTEQWSTEETDTAMKAGFAALSQKLELNQTDKKRRVV